MEHVVFYQSTQGTPAFRRMASIEDAVSFAEHLRNVEGVTDFSVYTLSPVSLKLRAYYHVEISDAARAAARPTATPTSATSAEPMPAEPMPTEPSAAGTMPTEPMPPAAQPQSAVEDRYAIPEPPPAAEETAPADEVTPPALPPQSDMPFIAGPSASASTPPDAFVKAEPAQFTSDPSLSAPASEPAVIDPSVVDPTTEEVMPVPTGRRSTGFFARS